MDKAKQKSVQEISQAAVTRKYNGMSTDRILLQIMHSETIRSIYDNQRARARDEIMDATRDLNDCEAVIDAIDAEIAGLRQIVTGRIN